MHQQGMYSSLAPVLWQNLRSKSIQRWEVGGGRWEGVGTGWRTYSSLIGFTQLCHFGNKDLGNKGRARNCFQNISGICVAHYLPQTSCQNDVRWYIIIPFLPLCVPLSGQGSQGHLMALRKCQLAGKRSTLYMFVSCTCVELHQEYPVTRIMEEPEQQCSQSRPKVWDHKEFRCYEVAFTDYHSPPSLQPCSI